MESKEEQNPQTEAVDPGKVSSGLGFAILAVIAVQLLVPIPVSIFLEYGSIPPEENYNLTIDLMILWVHVGWTQPLYLLPLAWYFHKRSLTEVRNGVLMVCGALFFVTSLCTGSMIGLAGN